MKTLDSIKVGEKAIIKILNTKGDMRRRFLDIGLIKGTKVECVLDSPSGNPKAYLIRGAVIAIRREDSATIMIEECLHEI